MRTTAERLTQALRLKRLTGKVLADRLGLTPESVYQVLRGQRPGTEPSRGGGPSLVDRAAPVLEVDADWLATGREDKAPAWARAGEPSPVYGAPGRTTAVVVREAGVSYSTGASAAQRDADRPEYDPERPGEVALVGSVAAGPGLVSFDDAPRSFRWRRTWAVMRVVGDSAFPLAFDGQFVVVDTEREVRHNNVVVVQTAEDGERRAYLKRYCVDRRAPDGYVLASINAGVDTPYIPKRDVVMIVPVVGVLFEEEPR